MVSPATVSRWSSGKATPDLHTQTVIAFGASFLANPELPEQFEADADLNPPNPATFYDPGGGPLYGLCCARGVTNRVTAKI